MEVGSLFLNLGIKNADKTVGSLAGIEKGLQQTAHMSLEAKAAIVGAAYALEQFFHMSGAQGTALSNFNTLLGTGTQTLQQYQYAARQVGVSNQEVENTFKHLSQAATEQRLLGKTPAYYGMVATKIGGFTGFDLQNLEKNPEKYLQYLQKYVDAEKEVGTRNAVLRSFGLSDNMIAAMVKHQFRPDVLSKAPTYSEGEVERLNRANIAWSNLNNKIQMAVGHFNASHGGQLQHDIEVVINIGLKLAAILLDIADKTKFFERLDQGFDKIDKFAQKVLPQIPLYLDKAEHAFHQMLELFDRFDGSSKVFDKVGAATEAITEYIRGLTAAFVPFLEKINSIEFFNTLMAGFGRNLQTYFGFLVTLTSNVLTNLANIAELVGAVGQAFANAFAGKITFGQIINDLVQVSNIVSNLVSIFTSLGQALVKIGEYFHVFDGIAEAVTEIVKAIEKVLNFTEKVTGGAKNLLGSVIKGGGNELLGATAGNQGSLFPAGSFLSDQFKEISDFFSAPALSPAAVATPNAPPVVVKSEGQKTQNFNLQQTLQFDLAKEEAKIVNDVKKAVNDAFRQLSSQIQGS